MKAQTDKFYAIHFISQPSWPVLHSRVFEIAGFVCILSPRSEHATLVVYSTGWEKAELRTNYHCFVKCEEGSLSCCPPNVTALYDFTFPCVSKFGGAEEGKPEPIIADSLGELMEIVKLDKYL